MRDWWLVRVVGDLVQQVRRHDIMLMAAGIAFYWLLGIIPLLLLGTSAIGYLLGSSDRAVDEVMLAARRLIPRSTVADVEEFLRTLIQNRHVTGVIGLGFLLWVAMGVFEAIASSLTTLTGGRETRSYLRRKLVALIMMGTVGFLFIAGLMTTWALDAWPEIEHLIGARVLLPDFLASPNFPRYLTTILLTAFFAILYRLAPVRALSWPATLTGALTAGMLWHQAKLLFNWYLIHYARYNLFYGILGGFIGVLLWAYYTAIILLVGGLLASALSGSGRRNRPATSVD
jgi:membrane protein